MREEELKSSALGSSKLAKDKETLELDINNLKAELLKYRQQEPRNLLHLHILLTECCAPCASSQRNFEEKDE